MDRLDAKARCISKNDINAVVRFLPILQSIPWDEAARWPKPAKGEGRTPTFSLEPQYHPQVYALMKALDEHGFFQPFDWGSWQNQAKRLFQNPKFLQRATLRSCIKLITTHVRKD